MHLEIVYVDEESFWWLDNNSNGDHKLILMAKFIIKM